MKDMPIKLQGAIQTTGGVVAIFPALLLVFSVFYDYSFLLSLGLSFEVVPTTIADHIRSAIVWAPKFAILIFCGYSYELLNRRIEGGQTEQELIEKSPTPKFTKYFRSSADYALSIVGVLAIVTQTAMSNSLVWLYFASMAAWGILAFSVVVHPRLGQRFTSLTRRIFVIGPMVFCVVGAMGYNQGYSMLFNNKKQWDLLVKYESTTKHIIANGVRRFGSSVVVVNEKKVASVLSNETILETIAIESSWDARTNLCKWFTIGCEPMNSGPAKPESPAAGLPQLRIPH